jgi:cysteine-rich repeat protein
MRYSYLLAVLIGSTGILAGVPAPSPTPPAGYDGCGGYCGDGIVQEPYEQCDLGSALNGAWNSGCSKNCTCTPVCGNGIKEWVFLCFTDWMLISM